MFVNPKVDPFDNQKVTHLGLCEEGLPDPPRGLIRYR
jgi:hypothetical protein